MPELPEVETIARDLALALTGQKVITTIFYNSAIRENCSIEDESTLNGKTLKRIRLLVDSNLTQDKKHLHFFIKFDKSDLSFYDVRKFGRICVTAEQLLQEHPRLGKLCPEPFDITSDVFADIIKRRNKAIKTVLLDQQIIAGLGNIYADESLFDAGIRPSIKPKRITRPRLKKLHNSIIRVLNKAIKNRGTSVDDYLDGFGQTGNFQNLIKVYGKTNQPCPRCGTPIKRIILGGRSTHYCARCQN